MNINKLWKFKDSLSVRFESIFLNIKYQVKRKFRPHDYLSGGIEGGKFPKSVRAKGKINLLPKHVSGKLIFFATLLLFIFLTDTLIKKWFLTNFHLNLNGVGTLRDLGGAAWQVLATVISVGLATIGIILQALSQEKNTYRRKILLHHYFTTRELDFKIICSFSVLILAGAVLLFKEKLFFYPLLSEHIFVIFALVAIFVYMFAELIIKSFDYLFPENQETYFDESLQDRLSYLIHESARSLVLIDVLQSYLDSFEMGINYIYDERDKKKPNMAIVETAKKGSIEDIDLSILKKLSEILGKKYIKEEKGKPPIKAELYIEYGRTEQRIMQPLALIHKENYSNKVVHLFKDAVILSTLPPPTIENDLQEYLEWAWDNVRQDLKQEKTGFTKDNLRNLYDFFENALTIFGDYKKKHKIEDGASIDKWDFLNDFRRQYFVTLDSAYRRKEAIEPLLALNYFPFALMQRAIYQNNTVQYAFASDLLGWVYKNLYNFDHPRKNDVRENFFLSNLNFAQFYLLGGQENFDNNFASRKTYMWIYLKVQINFIRRALELGDKKTITEVVAIVSKLIKEASYWQEDLPDTDLKEKVAKPQDQIRARWNAMFLGIQSWSFHQHESGNISKEMLSVVADALPWSDLFDLTQTFSQAIERDLENIMSWDWWGLEKRSYLDDGGSWGGFENEICQWYAIQAIKLVSKIAESDIPSQKRLIKDQDTYFKLLISQNGTIKTWLEKLRTDDKYLFLFDGLDRAGLTKSIEKLENYLKLTVDDNETSRRKAIIGASIEIDKVNKFKRSFIAGYTKASKIRKVTKSNGKLKLLLQEKVKPFYGIHVLVDKEPFTSISPMNYDGIATNYGGQIAQVEDYLIIKGLFTSKKPTTKHSYNATNAKEKLDAYIATIPKKQVKNTYIFILGNSSLRQELHRDQNYKWANQGVNDSFDEYREMKIYWTNVGKENGVVVVNLKDAFKIVQKTPDLDRGEMITEDKHVAFLLAELTDKEIDEILKAKPGGKNKDQFKENVRFWSFVYLDVEILKPDLIYKIGMQTDEAS